MVRPAILLSTRREYSRGARLLVALLTLLQFIAPTWHVCGGSGTSSCCPSEVAAQASTSNASTPALRHCSKCPRETSQLTPTSSPFGENCLAKMLTAMPWQNAALPAQAEYSVIRRRFAEREYFYSDSFVPTLPPARAPPRFS